MTVKQLKNISRKDVPIYYKMFYTAVAELDIAGKISEANVEFSLEMKPTGVKEVIVTALDEVDYPRVPLINELKKSIIALDSSGKLPL